MTRGRKPKPTAMKILAGNPGKRPLPQNEPTPIKGIPKAPTHLDRTAKLEWNRITKQLDQMGVLSIADRSALAQYCVYWSRWIDAETHLKKEGLTVMSPNNYPQQSPWLQISNKSMEGMLKILVEFGLTPSSRSKVTKIAEVKPESKLARYTAQ